MKDTFTQIIWNLVDIAKKDGLLDLDEFKLMSSVQLDISTYEKNLEVALEDGIIDESESKMLNDLKNRIYENAEALAHSDGVLTDEERDLLGVLTKFLKNSQN